ncbi:MAG: protease inhibitor I42 family protein [Dehalococcoidales bacterium]|nr:protease inhibitor I42 family protein [Dehalococcoidales bacterium]
MLLLRICLVSIMLVTVFSISSCIVTSHDYSVELSCEQFGENDHYFSDFELEIGDKIRLALCSNQTTGFQWDYEITTDNIVKEEDHDFEEPEEGIIGAAGIELWTFEAIEKGTTEIKMEYSQPWEGGLKVEWTYTARIIVK